MLGEEGRAGGGHGIVPTIAAGAWSPPTLTWANRAEQDEGGSPGGAGEFAGYELLGEIGRGGMGVVYKARQKQPNRTVALKMIRGGQFASPADVQRFHIEAQAAANLNHEGVLSLLILGLIQYFALRRSRASYDLLRTMKKGL